MATRVGCIKTLKNGIQLSNSENALFDTKILKVSFIKASFTFSLLWQQKLLSNKISVAITNIMCFNLLAILAVMTYSYAIHYSESSGVCFT